MPSNSERTRMRRRCFTDCKTNIQTRILMILLLSASNIISRGPIPWRPQTMMATTMTATNHNDHKVHCIPKLATPLASNTLNLVWSSWISTKYRTLNIKFADCMGWTWPAHYWQCDQAVAHTPKSLGQGQRWHLWAQTLKTNSEWSSPRMFHML